MKCSRSMICQHTGWIRCNKYIQFDVYNLTMYLENKWDSMRKQYADYVLLLNKYFKCLSVNYTFLTLQSNHCDTLHVWLFAHDIRSAVMTGCTVFQRLKLIGYLIYVFHILTYGCLTYFMFDFTHLSILIPDMRPTCIVWIYSIELLTSHQTLICLCLELTDSVLSRMFLVKKRENWLMHAIIKHRNDKQLQIPNLLKTTKP